MDSARNLGESGSGTVGSVPEQEHAGSVFLKEEVRTIIQSKQLISHWVY